MNRKSTTNLFNECLILELKNIVTEAVKEAMLKKETSEKQDDEILTIEGAAKLLHVTVASIHNWKKKKGLPYMKVGRNTRFLKSELLEYMKNNKAA